jgi:O-antigen ligase
VTASLVLWLMAWAGVFTGLYNLVPLPSIHDPLAVFQAVRAVLPVAAAYLCLLWALATRSRFRFGATTLGLFVVYGALGMIASVALSPDVATSLYWGSAYLAPLFVIWFIIERPEPLPILRNVLRLNAAIVVGLLLAVLPEAVRFGFGRSTRFEIYRMPFGLGEVRANGVGRYAVLVLIIAGVSLVTSASKKRLLWLPLAVPSLFVLMQTQSRSALLGLAVAGMLFVLVRGINLRFLIAGPVAAYAIWTSGVTWRAKGALSSLVFLTGRETTWQKGLAKIGESPIFGWGFHADRLLLDAEHMHNSYLHAAIQAGVPGALAFAAGLFVLWLFLWKERVLGRIRSAAAADQVLLMQAVLVLGFFTARSVFESTAAFYGVDLLFLVPAVAYIYQWALENPEGETEEA